MRADSLVAAKLHWIAGIALAIVGVILARIVAPEFGTRVHSVVAAGGQLVAISGLVVICFGVRRRVWSTPNLVKDPNDKST